MNPDDKMKRARQKIHKMHAQAGSFIGKIQSRLKQLCEGFPPAKRLIIVLGFSLALAGASLFRIAASLYNIADGNSKGKLMEMKHLSPLNLKPSKDSINAKDK